MQLTVQELTILINNAAEDEKQEVERLREELRVNRDLLTALDKNYAEQGVKYKAALERVNELEGEWVSVEGLYFQCKYNDGSITSGLKFSANSDKVRFYDVLKGGGPVSTGQQEQPK